MIDTVKIHTKDFEVGGSARIKLRQGVVDYNTGVIENNFFLFRDRSGQDIYGSGAYLNTDLFNLDINSRGLFLKYTPAKNMFGCNYYSVNNNQLKLVSQEVQDTLAENDIYLDMDSSDLSRVDLAKNIHTDKPIPAYSDLFTFLSGQRMKSYEFPSGYRYGNQSRQCVFYDKIEELLAVQKIDLNKTGIPDKDTLRGELRFLNHKVIKRDLPHTKLGVLYKKSNYDDMRDSYRHYLKKLVFRSGSDQELKFHYTREVEFLTELRKISKRNAVVEYIAVTGLDTVLQMFGSLDNFRSVLLSAGFQRQYTYRQVKQLQERLRLRSQINKKYESDSISKLYEEITTKLLN